jgi:hypothetical protein
MNAKKAKALRKMLRNWGGMSEESANMPQRQHLEKNPGTVVVTKEELLDAGVDPTKYEVKNVQTSPVKVLHLDNDGNVSSDGASVYKVKVKTGTLSNDPNSKRGIYRHFKEEMVRIESSRKSL